MAGGPDHRILYPLFAMFALVALVLGRMAVVRFGAVRSGAMDPAFYRTYQGGEEPEAMRVLTRHFLNLFEVPVLFYVVVLTAFVTGQGDSRMTVLAWVYVATRYVHSWVHLGGNDVLTRFRVYIASFAVLALMWACLFVRLLSAN